MQALPDHPTERDRERFRDITKAMRIFFEYDRFNADGQYKDGVTETAFRIWWSVERERQLLQNLNQSQGRKLSEMGAKLEKAEEVLRSLASFVGAGGYNADKVDADVFEQKIRWGIGRIMERLEKAESDLAAFRPVLYQRQSFGVPRWIDIHESQYQHFRELGAEVRTLYATTPPAPPSTN